MLQQSEPGREVQITIDDGMLAQGDPQLLRQVLENLIGNAWKFTSHTPEARIAVQSERRDAGPTYVVRDNGAGFDMQYRTKLFQPFQRLHAMSEFAGTGIGLSTVHRIITRHGGRVWAESVVGEGATFYFTLGDEQAADRERR